MTNVRWLVNSRHYVMKNTIHTGHMWQNILGYYNGLNMQIRWKKSNSWRKMVETHLVNVHTKNRGRDGKDTTDIEIRETGVKTRLGYWMIQNPVQLTVRTLRDNLQSHFILSYIASNSGWYSIRVQLRKTPLSKPNTLLNTMAKLQNMDLCRKYKPTDVQLWSTKTWMYGWTSEREVGDRSVVTGNWKVTQVVRKCKEEEGVKYKKKK